MQEGRLQQQRVMALEWGSGGTRTAALQQSPGAERSVGCASGGASDWLRVQFIRAKRCGGQSAVKATMSIPKQNGLACMQGYTRTKGGGSSPAARSCAQHVACISMRLASICQAAHVQRLLGWLVAKGDSKMSGALEILRQVQMPKLWWRRARPATTGSRQQAIMIVLMHA